MEQCSFHSNLARQTDIYAEADFYYKLRSPAHGGAVYVFLSPRSPLQSDGLVEIRYGNFSNNTAESSGGSIYISPVMKTSIMNTRLKNSWSDIHAKAGDVLYASSSVEFVDSLIEVEKSQDSVSAVYYQAANPLEDIMFVDNVSVICTRGYSIEQLNSTLSQGYQLLQIYCSPCPENRYSLERSTLEIVNQTMFINDDVSCLPCPYGATCNRGIWNRDEFWGSVTTQNIVNMYVCPENYCAQNDSLTVNFDRCAEHRYGTLCGSCEPGYSEALFGTYCVPNEECGLQNWIPLVVIAVYGFLYLLFFMFEHDWSRFLRYVSKKCGKNTSSEVELDSKDLSEAGYFPIFMYFIQTTDLLQINIIVEEDDSYGEVTRPQDIFPQFIIDGIKQVFNFEFPVIGRLTCFVPEMSPVNKVATNMIFFGYLYGLLLIIYLISGLCCVCVRPSRRPRIGGLNMDSRVLGTLLALFLYTYQEIAEAMLTLINCRNINGKSVLYLDGNVECIQGWQFVVIGVVCIFIFPFFLVLLFGPKLLKERKISLGYFFTSLLFPLFLAPPTIFMFFGCCRKGKRGTDSLHHGQGGEYVSYHPSGKAAKAMAMGHKPRITEDGKYLYSHDDPGSCCVTSEEVTDDMVQNLTGPYHDNLWKGVCWEGVMNVRRLILVIFATFVTDRLIRHMLLGLACSAYLLMHISLKPFKQKFPNKVESTSLALLVMLSGINLVRAAFFNSGSVPQGENYMIVVVIFEWIETGAFTLLPIVLLIIVMVSLCSRTRKQIKQAQTYSRPIQSAAVRHHNRQIRDREPRANPQLIRTPAYPERPPIIDENHNNPVEYRERSLSNIIRRRQRGFVPSPLVHPGTRREDRMNRWSSDSDISGLAMSRRNSLSRQNAAAPEQTSLGSRGSSFRQRRWYPAYEDPSGSEFGVNPLFHSNTRRSNEDVKDMWRSLQKSLDRPSERYEYGMGSGTVSEI